MVRSGLPAALIAALALGVLVVFTLAPRAGQVSVLVYLTPRSAQVMMHDIAALDGRVLRLDPGRALGFAVFDRLPDWRALRARGVLVLADARGARGCGFLREE